MTPILLDAPPATERSPIHDLYEGPLPTNLDHAATRRPLHGTSNSGDPQADITGRTATIEAI
jgi:hypothetical protein